MRKYYMAGNWKMNTTKGEAVDLAKALVSQLKGCAQKVMIAPPFTSLDAVGQVVKGSNILLGAQNMAAEEKGAHTGEISVLMLKDLGVSVVILGHSERRHIYGESDAFINRKVKLALQHGLDVILCVGETLDEREAGKAERICDEQTKKGLEGVSLAQLSKVTIAYEPVWAIGTGKNATPADAEAIHQAIRKTLAGLYSVDAAKKVQIQYGGSVKPDNVKELMAMADIDGALVGGAALKPESFVPIALF
jgi:triosephosphate isomerase (TIM)